MGNAGPQRTDVWSSAAQTAIAWVEYESGPTSRVDAIGALRHELPGTPETDLAEALDGCRALLGKATAALPNRVKARGFKLLPFATQGDIDRAALVRDATSAAPGVPPEVAETIVDFVIHWHWER